MGAVINMRPGEAAWVWLFTTYGRRCTHRRHLAAHADAVLACLLGAGCLDARSVRYQYPSCTPCLQMMPPPVHADLFHAAILGVPFVDCLTTMLDETVGGGRVGLHVRFEGNNVLRANGARDWWSRRHLAAPAQQPAAAFDPTAPWLPAISADPPDRHRVGGKCARDGGALPLRRRRCWCRRRHLRRWHGSRHSYRPRMLLHSGRCKWACNQGS